MDMFSSRRRAAAAAALAPLACVAALAGAGSTEAAGTARPAAQATLEGCVTAVAQEERSATFAGEMTAVPGTTRMAMRIELLERRPHDAAAHTVSAAGLGVWSTSAAHVRVYKDLNKVTNLAAPAFYRGAIRFRWIGAHGRIIKTLLLRTPRCEQPSPPAPQAGTPVV